MDETLLMEDLPTHELALVDSVNLSSRQRSWVAEGVLVNHHRSMLPCSAGQAAQQLERFIRSASEAMGFPGQPHGIVQPIPRPALGLHVYPDGLGR